MFSGKTKQRSWKNNKKPDSVKEQSVMEETCEHHANKHQQDLTETLWLGFATISKNIFKKKFQKSYDKS